MKLRIDVYKDSGKWYAGSVVVSDKDYGIHDSDLYKFIWDNLPANIGGGYIVVTDLPENVTFHNMLLTYNKLSNKVTPTI